MTSQENLRRRLAELLLLVAALAFVLAAGGEEPPADGKASPPIVQPGAPGEPSRIISAADASNLSDILWSEADVKFMRDMIHHHAQALTMTALVEKRSESEDLGALAQRIDLSQRDEIEMMEEWLRSHDRAGADAADAGDAADAADAGDAHHEHGDTLMPGMLTPEQMKELERARKGEFDRLFLEGMIAHHRGALVMVEDLLDQPGAAQESTVFAFTADVVADQGMEIDRMATMLQELQNNESR